MIISESSRQSAIKRFGGKRELYEKALITFARDLPDAWRGFEEACADIEETRRDVHKIKGVAGNLSLDEIYQSAIDFELSIKNGEPDSALYSSFCAACAEYKKEVLPAAVISDSVKQTGTRAEFFDSIYIMKEALEQYDIKRCADAAARLSGTKWSVSKETEQKLEQLYKLIENYEYDEALTLLNEM